MSNDPLDTALKEWAGVCDRLTRGEQAILLRKGGIHESGGPGVFELEHPRFLLFPAWTHQKPDMVKPDFADAMRPMQEPAEVTLRAVASPASIYRVPSRASLEPLDALHPWNEAYLDMRWNYKPERPLWLVVLRVARLPEAVAIANDPEYAGCRSWVPLKPGDAVDVSDAESVLSDAALEMVKARVAEAMAAGDAA